MTLGRIYIVSLLHEFAGLIEMSCLFFDPSEILKI